MGFIPVRAVNGLDVLRVLNFERLDAVLLDIGMEPINGIVVLKHIKREVDLSSLPVIMVSGDDSKETIEKCRKNGSAGYLKKPVTIAELRESPGGMPFRKKEALPGFSKERGDRALQRKTL